MRHWPDIYYQHGSYRLNLLNECGYRTLVVRQDVDEKGDNGSRERDGKFRKVLISLRMWLEVSSILQS
jgi:hypothetical protein